MATLYIMRHGIAEEESASGNDADRRLTERGRRRTAQVARGLARIGVAPELIFTSPYRRTVETAQIIARAFPKAALHEMPELASGASPTTIVRALQCAAGANRVMLIGHQPDLGELISFLLTGSANLAAIEVKKATVAAIRLAAFPPRPPAVLRWLMSPKQLARS